MTEFSSFHTQNTDDDYDNLFSFQTRLIPSFGNPLKLGEAISSSFRLSYYIVFCVG